MQSASIAMRRIRLFSFYRYGAGFFFGAFAKLRKATMSFVMSVRMKQLGFHWTDFHEIWYLGIFRTTAEKIQVSLKSGKNSGYFT